MRREARCASTGCGPTGPRATVSQGAEGAYECHLGHRRSVSPEPPSPLRGCADRIQIYSIVIPGVTAGKIVVGAQSLPFDSKTTPLLRYLRYRITLAAATAFATVTIEGIARRGLRVG